MSTLSENSRRHFTTKRSSIDESIFILKITVLALHD